MSDVPEFYEYYLRAYVAALHGAAKPAEQVYSFMYDSTKFEMTSPQQLGAVALGSFDGLRRVEPRARSTVAADVQRLLVTPAGA